MIMKRFVVSCICLLMFGLSSAVAQESPKTPKIPKPEFLQQKETPNAISANVGLYSTDQLLTAIISIPLAFQEVDGAKPISTCIPVGVRYMRTLTPTISVGAAMHYTGNYYEYRDDNNLDGHYSINYFSLSAECRFTYLRKNLVKLYGSVGVGLSYINLLNRKEGQSELDEHAATVAFNISPFGIRVGRQVGGYIELGVGYRGLVAAGVDIRF